MSQKACQSYKTAHQSIIDSVDQLMPLLRSYSQAKPKLRILHQKLLNHFGRQNQELFDRLRDCHRSDPDTLKLLDFLLHESKGIRIQFLLFSDKHSGEMGDVNARTFPLDFQNFIRDLIAYLKIEDEYLLPLLERLP